VGFGALFHTTTGGYNTAIGEQTLYTNVTGVYNTATGYRALYNNTADKDVADGFQALYSNTTGGYNTASGFQALFSNTTGSSNVANGAYALYSNTTGIGNTTIGTQALYSNATGGSNMAIGQFALFYNITGSNNTAIGSNALFYLGMFHPSGSGNIALGSSAGDILYSGSNNIYIGNRGGLIVEDNTIRIGTVGTQTATFIAGISGTGVTGTTVVVNSSGQLGVAASSARFKDEIRPMDKASEAILALRPVAFRYKHELDPKGIPQFGLLAEDVEKVNPDLVVRDAEGKVFTVRYEAVNAMLLNEFLKEHRKVEEQNREMQEQEAAIAQLKSTVAQQQKGMEAVIARLEEQDSQIKMVTDQIGLGKVASEIVVNAP
jgi:hypothetical protein